MAVTDDIVPHPALFYVSDADDLERAGPAVTAVLEAFGLEAIMATDPVVGSFWQALVLMLKRQSTETKLNGVADTFVQGAKARWLDETQASITQQQAEAISRLLDSLQASPDAFLTFSNMLIAKVGGVPVVRELTHAQVEFLMQNPSLSRFPAQALVQLDAVERMAAPVGVTTGDQPHALEL